MSFKTYLINESKLHNVRSKIIDFFSTNKKPSDKQVHEFAANLGIDEHKFEEEIYSLLGDFFSCGKSSKETKKIDPKQLKMGIAVEMEHTCCPLIAEKISTDHLIEFSNYYTLLKEMEDNAKSNA